MESSNNEIIPVHGSYPNPYQYANSFDGQVYPKFQPYLDQRPYFQQNADEMKKTNEQQYPLPPLPNVALGHSVHLQTNRIYNSECLECHRLLEEQDVVYGFQCVHSFCKGCLTVFFKKAIKNGVLIECPVQPCQKGVDEKCLLFRSLSQNER